MSFTLVNLTGYKNGVQADETGIAIKEFKLKVQPELKVFAYAKDGTATGFGLAPNKGEVSLSGEVKGSTGIMAATASTATTFANSVSFFGAPTTGFYLDSADVTANREGGAWMEMSAEFSAYAGIP
jgi:hypothetical protein